MEEKSGQRYLDHVIQVTVTSSAMRQTELVGSPLGRNETTTASLLWLLTETRHLNLITGKCHTNPQWETVYNCHLQQGQGNESQGKTGGFPQPEGDQRDLTTECHRCSRTGSFSWNGHTGSIGATYVGSEHRMEVSITANFPILIVLCLWAGWPCRICIRMGNVISGGLGKHAWPLTLKDFKKKWSLCCTCNFCMSLTVF